MCKIRILRKGIKDIGKLPNNYARLITEHIDNLAQNPRPADSKKLQGKESYSLRVGVYRALYDIDDELRVVTIYRIRHRREVYR